MKEKIKQLQSLLLLLILTVVGTASAWGETTVSATKFTSSQNNTTYTISAKAGYGSLDGITVKTEGTGGGVNSDRFKVPAGTLTIAGTGNNIIKSVTITWNNTSNNYPASNNNFTSAPAGVSTTSTTSTWTGSSSSVVFTNTTTNTFQVIGLEVTYSTNSGTTYTVSYNMNGHGNAIPNVTGVTALPAELPSPTATGYTFAGWYTDSGLTSSATPGASIGDDTTLYAKWTLNPPTFDPASGNLLSTDHVTISGIASSYLYTKWGGGASDAETLKGQTQKTFDSSGEYSAGASGTGTRVLSAIAYDGTLYSDVATATYTVRTANTLSLNTSSGSVAIGNTLNISGYVTDKNSDATVTYTSSNPGVATVTSDGVISPVATGTATITVAQEQNTTYGAGSATFTVTVTSAATYTVTFNANGHGTVSPSSATQTSAGAEVALATVTPQDDTNHKYAFASWNTEPDGSGFTISAPYVPTADITIYAQYTKTHHKVLSAVGAGEGSVSMENASTSATINPGDWVENGTTINVTANPATGYEFDTEGNNGRPWGSATGTKTPTLSITIDDSKEFTAYFKAKTYTIALDKNNGSASANGYATATYNSNKLTGIYAPTYAGKVVEGYYKEAARTNKIADASGNLVASVAGYTDDSGNWTNDAATTVTLYAKWVDASSSYTPFDLSSADAVIDFSDSKWSTSAATALFNAANAGNGANTPINNVVFRGQTSGNNKAFTISGGKLVMDVGNGQSGNRWFAIPLTNINGRIDVYIKTPYAKGTSFSVKAVLDKGTTTVGTSATNLNAVKLDYVDNYFGTGDGAFHFRIKDFTQTTGVLYIGRNGSSWTDINKIKIVSEAEVFNVSPTSVTVGDAGTKNVTISNNTPYSVLIDDTNLDKTKATYSRDGSTITFSGVSEGDAGSIDVYLDRDNDGVYDSGTEEKKTIYVTVNGLSWSTNITTEALRYTTKGATAATLTVAATGATYQWYKNSKNSTSGATAIDGAKSASYTPSTDFDEDLSYYYCVASKEGYKSIISNIKPVLTTVSERTFWMNTITRRSTTSASELPLTNGEDVNIYGGTATFKGNGSEFNYVYVYDDAFFQVNSGSYYYKIDLNTELTAGMTITLTTNGLTDGRGVWLSQSSSRPADDDASRVAFTGTNGVNTQSYTVRTRDAIIGATDLYVYSSDGSSSGYFGPLYITEALPLTVSAATPATQTVQQYEDATAITVSASGGVPDYHYQWYQDTSATGSFTTTAVGTGNNTASFTPSTASTGTLYYRCTVTDSKSPTSATVNSSVVSVDVKTSVDYYKIGTGEGEDAAFTTDGKYTFETTRTKYEAQASAQPPRNYWTIVSRSSSGAVDDDCYDDEKSGFNLFMKSSSKTNGVKSTTFYVKGAKAFKIITNGSGEGRTYRLTIDGVVVGNETRESTEASAIMHTLNNEGSIITIDNANNDIRIKNIIFYKLIPTTLNIQKNGAEITEDVVYVDNAAPTFNYDVYTDGDGTIGATPTVTNPTGLPADKYVVRNASYADGVLTITKGNYPGTATITLTQADGTIYKGTTKEFKFTVQKHQIAISVSSPEVTLDLDLDNLSKDAPIQAGKLPTFTVTKDGEPWPAGTSVLKYISDDNSVAYLSKSGDFSSTTYDVKYGGGQGGPEIIAYIEESDTYTGDKNSYTLHITQGTDNFISKDMKDETMEAQRVYPMDDANGQTVVKLVYGGYKYNDNRIITIEEGAASDKDDIVSVKDSWTHYTGAKNAKMDGYTYNMRNGAQNAKSEDKVEILSNPTDDSIWYQAGYPKDGGGTYAANERIKPFAMPCAGSYLMFEVKKTGILTAYVLQNGIVGHKKSNDEKIATNPRLGYWFDQDGWVQHPTSVVSKAVISDGNGRDQHKYSGQTYPTPNSLESKTFYGDVEGTPSLLYKQLTYKYCDNAENPNEYFAESGEGHTAINPYYWPTETSDGDISIDANRAKQVPRKIRPIPYRNGYLMIEEGYLKYTLPVKAGQKYYFLGCGTRIGYVAMNFVENKDAFGANTIDYVEDNVDLKGSDDWTSPTVRAGFTKPTKPTVYSQMTLKRNFTPNQWNTICLPFAVSEKDVEAIFGTGTKLCLYNGLTKKGGNAYVINFMRHVNQDILPGQPYFIYPTGTGVQLGSNGKIGGTTGVEFYNVLVDPAKLTTGINYGSDNDREDGATEKNNEIRYKAVATLAPTAMKQNGFYINTNNGALMKYTPSSDLTVNTYRTFLQPNDWAGTNYSALSLDADLDVEDVSEEGDVPTMILVVGEDKAEIVNAKLFDGKAYNLMGQEVDAANAKGMVIVNGKKYFRK